jgi:hypothetical protein
MLTFLKNCVRCSHFALLWLALLAVPVSAHSAGKTLLVLGDSLSAEYGLPVAKAGLPYWMQDCKPGIPAGRSTMPVSAEKPLPAASRVCLRC